MDLNKFFGSHGRARDALQVYFDVTEGRGTAKYLECEGLEEKAAQAKDILKSCCFCERRCGVDRTAGERGFCRVLESKISSEFLHFGEEPELVPSYTIFFSGCTFGCVFCQNADISQNPESGAHIPPETVAKMIEKQEALNVNWVGGDPTPNLAFILEVLTHLTKNIPQVWNSNMYLTEEAMALLDGVIDVYLTDFKYGKGKCAEKYSKAPDYWNIVTRNHLEAARQAEVLVRHLVLPNHVNCCTRPILEWLAENIPDARVNVMDQYRPQYRAREFPELSTNLHFTEYEKALGYAIDLGLNVV